MSILRPLVLRGVLGRLRVDEKTLRHLSRYQRLGEAIEADPPDQMAPVGLRTLLRGARTQSATQIRPDWVWPFWIERQLDPRSPSFVPRGHLPFVTNMSHRNWTMVGNPDSKWEAVVDEAGLVTPWFDGWSLDWWIGARDGWHFPSRDAGLRQVLLENAPVVQTTMPLPRGSAVQRVYAVFEEDELVVAEVENRTPDQLEIAFALRPYNPEGLSVVRQVELHGHTVFTEGRAAIFLPDAPTRFLASSFAHGDTARLVDKGLMDVEPGKVKDEAGLIQAAVIYEVAAGQTLRVAMPFDPKRRTQVAPVRKYRLSHAPAPDVVGLQQARSVAAQWGDRLRKEGMRVELPDQKLQAAVDANRSYMLLFHDADDMVAGPYTYRRFWFRDAAYQVAALDRWGFHREAEQVLRSYPERQRRNGSFNGQSKEWDAAGTAIWTIAEHYRLTGDSDFAKALRPSVGQASRWLSRRLSRRRRARPGFRGLLPAGVAPEHLGPFDFYYWDDFWALRGLRDAADLLRQGGTEHEERARAAEAAAEKLQKSLFESIERTALKLGRRIMSAGPRRGVDAGMIGSLVSVWPLRLLTPENPWVVVTLDAIRDEFMVDDALFQGVGQTGLGTYLTLQLGFVELETGDPDAWRRFQWLLEAATPTFTWPEAIHPRLGTGCMGDGHFGWTSAEFLSFLRNVLIRETTDGSIALMSLLPPDWEGRDVRVHDAPTHQGKVSFELTWRDESPVLSWECEREGVRLIAPGLDPNWSSEKSDGRSLLSPLELSYAMSSGPFGNARRRRRRTPRLAP